MTLAMQLITASILLMVCSGIHLGLLVVAAGVLRWAGSYFPIPHRGNHWGMLTAIAFTTVIFAHTIQVWLWAVSFMVLGALTQFTDALYFALVTYTTLGYGDVTVSEGFRLFAAMAAVTGLLNFGLSTAFLVGLMTKILPTDIKGR